MRLDPNELRKLADAIEPHMYGPQQAIPDDLRRAADEIERLRAALDRHSGPTQEATDKLMASLRAMSREREINET